MTSDAEANPGKRDTLFASEVDEDSRRRFEAAWRGAPGASPPRIDDFLPPPDDPRFQATLEELAAIDLELSWRHGILRTAAEYLARFPALAASAEELAREEARLRAAPPRLVPGMALGRYRLIEVHARGAFGVVWRAEDESLGREVALKWPVAPADAGTRARFVAEARVTAQLEHPGIVPVHTLGEAVAPYYVMKLVRGQTLTEVIRAFHTGPEAGTRGVAWRRLLEVFLAATRALAHAHARGFVHRDIKPDNILVGELGETIVLDWGLTRSPTPGDEDGTILGTPAYMAPEQAEGRVADHDARTDVHGLGAVLFELVSGVRPSEGGVRALALSRGAAGIPRALLSICRKAMARDPAARYGDAAELGRDLERFLADEPVRAHRERIGERLARSMRAHRTRWAMLGVTLVLSIVGTAIALVLMHDARLRRLADVSATALRDETLARADLQSGRPLAAIHLLALALDRTQPEAALDDVSARLIALRDRARRLAELDAHAERAWFLSGEERDADALRAAELALKAAGAPVCADFEDTLGPERTAACRHRMQRLMLLTAIVRAKGALALGGGADCDRAWVDLQRARAEGPTAFGELVQSVCARLSPNVPKPATRTPSTGATDAFFFGLIHLWIGDLPPAIQLVVGPMLADPASGLDLAHPKEAAIERLREAVRLEPSEFWHHFMLGAALAAAGDNRAAGLVFEQCVAARPDYPRGLEMRGLAAILEGQAGQKPELVTRGLADYDRALVLAPDDPWTHWSRANMLVQLERGAEAWAHYQRAMLLDPDALFRALPLSTAAGGAGGGLSTAPQVAATRDAAASYLHTHASDGIAWSVYAAACLALGNDAEALRAADIALGLPTPPPLARTLRGIVRLRRKAAAEALLELAGSEPLALAARALALMQLGRKGEARQTLEALEASDAPAWQREWARAHRE